MAKGRAPFIDQTTISSVSALQQRSSCGAMYAMEHRATTAFAPGSPRAWPRPTSLPRRALCPQACTPGQADGPAASTPGRRRRPGPGLVAGLPLWVGLNALHKALRAFRLPRAAAEEEPTLKPPLSASAVSAASHRARDPPLSSNIAITESLRRLADDVDAELAALRAAAAEHARRREEAERLLDAARDEMRRMERRRAARQGATKARGHEILLPEEESTQVVLAAKLMTELCKAQTRAAAAEKRGDAFAEELEELRRGFERKQADMVLATALWCFMGLTVVTYLAHLSTSWKFLQNFVPS